MRFSKILLFAAVLALLPLSCGKKQYSVKGNTVTVKLEIPGQARNDGQPAKIRLQVLGEKLIRVSATPDKKFNDRKSLVVLPRKEKTPFQVSMDEGIVKVSTSALTVTVDPATGKLKFTDAAGPAAFAVYIRAILLRDTGACISPFAAFLLLQGTETLSLRLERHAENTKKVVEYLVNHPQVEKVYHPSLADHPDHALYAKYFPNGGGSIFTFDIKGGKEEAFKFIDGLEIFSLLANVADVKSLVIHPATTTHSQLTEAELTDQGIYQSTVRLSIGTEHVDDLIADLTQALDKI